MRLRVDVDRRDVVAPPERLGERARRRCTAHDRYPTGRSPQIRFRIRRRFQSAIS